MKFVLKFNISEMPELVAGEIETDTPFKAGLALQDTLKARIGEKKFDQLKSATIYDEAGNERAILQIDTTVEKSGKVSRRPRWNCWLTIRDTYNKKNI